MKFDVGETTKMVEGLFQHLYPDNHDIEVSLSNIKLSDEYSNPFHDGTEVVTAMVHRSVMTINVRVDEKFSQEEWFRYRNKLTKVEQND